MRPPRCWRELEPSFPACLGRRRARHRPRARPAIRAAPPRCCWRPAGGDDLPLIPFRLAARGIRADDALPARARRARRGRGVPPTARRRARESSAFPSPAPLADRAHAMVALDGGDPLAAVERALASATTAGNTARPWRRPLSRLLAGRALAAAGETERAAAELETAAAAFDALRCARAAGRPPSASSASSDAVCTAARARARPTARESSRSPSASSEVARLVVDRKTNAQIASELFLSPKTVETPHPPPLPQARRVVAGGGRARGRACRPREPRRPRSARVKSGSLIRESSRCRERVRAGSSPPRKTDERGDDGYVSVSIGRLGLRAPPDACWSAGWSCWAW